MAIDFPDSSSSPFVGPNGVTYTWVTSGSGGYWQAQPDPNEFLSKVNNDTAAGQITFEGRTNTRRWCKSAERTSPQ